MAVLPIFGGSARPPVLPPDVKEELDRGRREMMADAPKRRLCARFERGETYFWHSAKTNSLISLPLDTASGKPGHRQRNTYNIIRPLVEDKVSVATSRVPSYDIVPSTGDPEDRGASGVSRKVSLYGYHQWGLRGVRQCTVKSAIAQGGDGFAWPYWEQDVGPYRQTGEDVYVGRGEVKIATFGGNEVYWEPGVKFRDARWYAVERAVPVGKAMQEPGFFGPKLTPDASTSDVATDSASRVRDNLVMVTDYLERPCSKYPLGRRITIANNRVIADQRLVDPEATSPWAPYPLFDHEGNVLDEPVLHRLSYTWDPDTDRDLGLVWQLVDCQRTYQDCVNKLLEWKNRALNPQMTAVINSLLKGVTPNDEPGFCYWRKPGTPPPEYMQAPAIPEGLFRVIDLMRETMQFIAAYADAQATSNVAAATVQAVQQQSQSRWESFLGDLAEWDARLMRHCLMLVARHYDIPRLISIKGWFGPERIKDFTGAQLHGQVDVTVLPGSLVQLSRGEAMNRVQFLAQSFPGWLTPEMALAYIDGGAAQNLVQSYELDVARIEHIIGAVRDGTVNDMPTRTETDPLTGEPLSIPGPLDPLTGEPGPPEIAKVPFWMPIRDVDNLQVWKRRLGDWMKTEDYERMEEARRAPATMILAAVNRLEAEEAQRQAAMMAQQAADMGMANAVKPAGPKALPSTPDGATPGGA